MAVVTQTLLDKANTANVDGFINDVPMKLNDEFTSGTVKFVAKPNTTITKITYRTNTGGQGSYTVASDKLSASSTSTYALDSTTFTTVTVIPNVLGVNKVYKIKLTDIPTLLTKKMEFVSGSTTVQYGQNLLGLIELPFAIPSSMVLNDGNVKLGTYDTGIVGTILNDDVLTVDLGSITIPKIFNNSLDYINAVSILHLPYCEPFNIENEYVIGQTLTIAYDVNLYNGSALIRITSNKTGGVIVTKNIDLNIEIPFGANENNNVKGNLNNVELGGYNTVKTPYIEIVRNESVLPTGFFTIPVIDEKPLLNEKGFLKIEEIKLEINANDSERESIISLLSNGVIIK